MILENNQCFTTKNSISCRFCVDALYQIKEIIVLVCWELILMLVVVFCQSISVSIELIMRFLFYSVNVLNLHYWFSLIELSLHSWTNSWLITVHFPFIQLCIRCSNILLRIFVSVFMRTIGLSFSCNALIRFWSQDCVGII